MVWTESKTLSVIGFVAKAAAFESGMCHVEDGSRMGAFEISTANISNKFSRVRITTGTNSDLSTKLKRPDFYQPDNPLLAP